MLIQEVRSIRKMKLIVVSNPININNEHSIVCSLFENGLEYFHLRKPDLTLNELDAYIKLIPKKHHNKIVLHSHHQLALEYELKGIHFTQKNPYSQWDGLQENLQLSASFHSIEELEMADPVFKYVFLSPVFDSISKEGYKSPFDHFEIKNILANRTKGVEIIALGGVDTQNINTVIELGFEGVAILGAIWNSKEPIKSFVLLKAVKHSLINN